MNIKLHRSSYSGDGSSLSEERCNQLVMIHEMLNSMGNTIITYKDIQREADKRKLFGETKTENAIRTFFPICKKLGFVTYDGSFPANTCFTELGTIFVLACRALNNLSEETPHKEEIRNRLCNIKRNAQLKGLVNMYQNPEYKTHNIWIALKLLKQLSIINWNEFLYTLHCLDEGKSIENAIEEIRSNKKEIDEIEFQNKNGTKLPNTSFTYVRSFLEEAGLISNVSTSESKLLEDANLFYSQINI